MSSKVLLDTNVMLDLALARPEGFDAAAAIAEAEAALAGEGRVLVRKSGTESVIRVLAEAPDQAAADAAMKRIANALEAL